MQREQVINKIKQKLKEPLPGSQVQFEMAPLNRRNFDITKLSKEDYMESAVMLLLCIDDNDNLFIPLTQRYTYEGAHSGQISLPGGKFDEEDNNLTNTALRECFEEIGIERENIEILGPLTPLFIPVSKFLVQPIIGFCDLKNIRFNKSEREVKKIVNLTVKELVNGNIERKGTIEIRNGETIKAPYFEVDGLIVWGATAMILNEFKALLDRIS